MHCQPTCLSASQLNTSSIPTEISESAKKEKKKNICHVVWQLFKSIVQTLTELPHKIYVNLRGRRISQQNTPSPHPASSVLNNSASSTLPKNPVSSQHLSLEEDFQNIACKNVDTKADCCFEDYLWPNEAVGTRLQAVMEQLPTGTIAATGSERCFFDLLCSNPSTCEGLVGIDINPRIKAYIDFVVILLKISTSREDFCRLAQTPDDSSDRYAEIRTKINEKLPSPYKEYYLSHLEAFGQVYYATEKDWIEDEAFDQVNYHKNNHLFEKLQSYAVQGKIVATIGSINDLHVLKDRKISVVDASNVCDYIAIDLQGNETIFPVHLISTSFQPSPWSLIPKFLPVDYHLRLYTPLTPAERTELDELNAHLTAAINPNRFPKTDPLLHKFKAIALSFEIETDIFAYTLETLQVLRAISEHLTYTEARGWVCKQYNPYLKSAAGDDHDAVYYDPIL